MCFSGDSASITLACCGSVSFFSAICEPLILGKKFSMKDLGVGVAVMIGVLFVYFSLPSSPSPPSSSEEGSHKPIVNYNGAVFSGVSLGCFQ